ncbi:MAG: tetratricopeptide repeat-containing protein kinase family protein, partial [Planctomycetota bacterium]
MSPEQLERDSDSLDTRCDVYALGLVLYRLLAGRPPFVTQGMSLTELASATRKGPEALGRIDPSLRGDLEIIVGTALAYDRDRRYSSAGQLADDLRRHLRREPILAHPPSRIYVLRKFAHRNKALVAGCLMTVLTLVGGLIASGILLYRTEVARAEADLSRQRMETIAAFQATLLEGIEVPAMGARLITGFESAIGVAATGRVSEVDGTNLARDVLEDIIVARALEELDTGYTDDPVVEAELRASIARITERLFLYDQAIAQWRRVVALREQEHGPDHPLTIDSIYQFGVTLGLGLEWSEAVTTLQDAAERSARTHGSEHRATLRSKAQLAAVLTPLGRRVEADQLLSEVVTTMRRVLPPMDSDLLHAEGLLASVYSWTRPADEAIAQFERILADSITAHGEYGESVLTLRQNLATLYSRNGLHAQAKLQIQIAHEGWRTIAGDRHEATVVTGYHLGETLLALKQFERAEEVLRASRESAEDLYGPDHLHRIIATKLHARSLYEVGLFDEGLTHARFAVDRASAVRGDDAPFAGSAMYWLARNLNGLGQSDRAEAAYRDAIDTLAEALNWQDEYAGAVTGLAALLLEQRRFTAAEEVLLPAASTLLQRRTEDHDPAASVVEALVALYHAWDIVDPGRGHDRSAAHWLGMRREPGESSDQSFSGDPRDDQPRRPLLSLLPPGWSSVRSSSPSPFTSRWRSDAGALRISARSSSPS